MIPVGLDYLAEMYDQVQIRKREIREEVREKYRARMEEEVEKQIELEDSRIGVAIVRAVEQGYKRADIARVIRTNDSAKYRRYIELGGGTIRTRKTLEERAQERAESINVVQIADNQFDYEIEEGAVYRVEVQWARGVPFIWPVEHSQIGEMKELFGFTRAMAYDKGAEIVAAFGIEEE